MRAPELPAVSLVVPTRSRPGPLVACLEAVAGLDYPRERLEVIVVDDGGRPAAEPVAAPFGERLRLRVLRQGGAGPASARNAGAAVAGGTYLAFTDDDCAPAADWLLRLAERLREVPGAMAGGATGNGLPDNPYSEASQALVSFLYARFNRDPERAGFLASNNLALPADRFRALGGFDPRYPLAAGEDRDLCERWRSAGLPVLYVPEARVVHRHALGPASFWRQHVNYGRGACRVRRAAAAKRGAGLRLEAPGFYRDLLGYSLRDGLTAGALRALLLAGVSQVATASGFALELLGGAPPGPPNERS